MKNGDKIFFDNLSKNYDKGMIKNYFKGNHVWIVKNLPDLNGKQILDVGCGTGELLNEIEKIYPQSSCIGVDISEEMLHKANDKNKNIKYLVADVHNLPFDDNTFDFVLNTISFHHYVSPQSALNEMIRVLKPGGYIYILDSVKDPRFISFMPWYWDRVDSKICYSKHLFTKEFYALFNNTDVEDVHFKKYYKLFPAVHILCVAKK